jgi:hypothetical protein
MVTRHQHKISALPYKGELESHPVRMGFKFNAQLLCNVNRKLKHSQKIYQLIEENPFLSYKKKINETFANQSFRGQTSETQRTSDDK